MAKTSTAASAVTAPPRAEYLTRREVTDYIRHELGVPLSYSTAMKLGALGEFVKPAVYWGRRPLYTRDGARKWVKARSRPAKSHDQAGAAA